MVPICLLVTFSSLSVPHWWTSKLLYIFLSFFFLPFFPPPGTHGIMLHNKTFPLGILGIQACSLFLQWSMTARQCFFFSFLNMCSITQYQTCCSCRGTTCYSVSSLGSSTPVPVTSRDEHFLCQVIYLACQSARLWLKRVYWPENISLWIYGTKFQKYEA